METPATGVSSKSCIMGLRRKGEMSRQLIKMVFATVLLQIVLAGQLGAQVRGLGPRGGGAIHSMPSRVPAQRPAFVFRPTPVVTPGIDTRFAFLRPRRAFFQQPVIGGYLPYWYGPDYAPPLYSEPNYVSPAYNTPTYTTPDVGQNDAELTYQVQQLSQEVEQLRQSLTEALHPPPPPAPPSPSIPTVLVFRDGHRRDIQNYAIVGQMLWILDEATPLKISLSELNLNATQNENASRGVRFPLPR